MNTPAPCPVCGSEVPDGAPEGMCPRCLITLAESAGAGMPGSEATLHTDSTSSRRVSGAGLDAPLPGENFKAGTRVGDYELLREVGRGGMGVVYEARHTGLKRKVAIKMLPWAEFATNEQRERFRREAEAVARLHHSHIVAVYEWGSHGGCPFMAMQLVEDARSLAEEIVKGPMPPRDAARVLAKVARAVHYSHQHGVLHRDIKPGNILLDAKGEPLLVDFGLARLEDAAFQLTHSDLVFGTPSYMPPEQAAGEDITTAADVYSLGAVLYEALTGKPPFRGKTVAETMRMVTEQEPVAPRLLRAEVARDLNTIVLKCLEKKPSRRYASCDALAEDLERWLEDWPIRARPGTMTTRAVKWARRRPGVAGLAAALVITAFLGLTGILLGWRETELARKKGMEQLWNSLLAEAKSRRVSHQPGRRFGAIESLQKAAAIQPSSELQNEVVAALALSDLRPAEAWEGNPEMQSLVALSRDFTLVASTRANGTIVVTSREDMKPLATLQGEGTPVNWILRFSPDGRWLAAGYCAAREEQAHVVVWDWKNSQAMLRLAGVTRSALDFWPDSTRLVVCIADELHFPRLPDGAEDRPLKKLPGSAHTVRVSSSGRYIAASLATSSKPTGSVAVLDTKDLSDEPVWPENISAVRMLSWHPHLDWLAAPCGDGSIRVWDATEKRLLQTITGHTGQVNEVVWNPAGDLMASSSTDDGTLKLWDAATRELFVSLDQPTGPLMFSADGTRLGPGQDGTNVRLFEVAPLMACRRLHAPSDGTVWSAAWNAEGELLATAGNQVRLWNTAGYELASVPFANPRSVLFTKDSLIVSGGDGVSRWPLHINNVGNERRATLGEPTVLIRDHDWEYAAMSVDEKLLAVASPNEVALFDLADRGAARTFLRGHVGASNIAVSPDGHLVATGTSNGDEVWVWNPATCACVTRLPVHGGAGVAFTMDGKWLVTGSAEEYRSWDTAEWKPGAVHPRRDNMPGPIAVSPRDTILAIGYTRNKVRLVYPTSLESFLEPDCGPHSPLCFSRDGSLLVSTNLEGHVFVWDIAWIRHEVKRQLDWKRFRPMEQSHAQLINRVVLPSP